MLSRISVAILDAGRNSMSFFMLLVVALGLSVVRESLDRTMLKCQALAVAHFIFGGKWKGPMLKTLLIYNVHGF